MQKLNNNQILAYPIEDSTHLHILNFRQQKNHKQEHYLWMDGQATRAILSRGSYIILKKSQIANQHISLYIIISPMSNKKVNVYIDGFNMYYALKKKIDDPKSGRTTELKRCNYRKLFSHFLADDEELNKVYYFTAYRIGNKKSMAKHKAFVEALTKYNVMPILGKY